MDDLSKSARIDLAAAASTSGSPWEFIFHIILTCELAKRKYSEVL